MPTLYVPKLGTFDGVLSQLETLKALDSLSYQRLQDQYKTQTTAHATSSSTALPTLTMLAALALKDVPFQQAIHTAYNQLHTDKPAQKERFELSAWQREIKADTSRAEKALDINGRTDFTTRLRQKLLARLQTETLSVTGKDVHKALVQDATVLHRLLTPSVKITRDDQGTVSEQPYQLKDYIANPPNIIFVMGNNDLRQIDFVASLYHTKDSVKKPLIYVSGFGGHGTMHDPVFARQEGETMYQRLRDLGVAAEHLRVEHDAVDTGRNVTYMDIFILLEYTIKNQLQLIDQHLLVADKIPFLHSMLNLPGRKKRSPQQEAELSAILSPIRQHVIENNVTIFEHILVSGTPGGLRRQTSTLEQQKKLPWKHISCITPFEFGDFAVADTAANAVLTKNYYYNTLSHALINFIYALREIASYLDYTVNSEFLSRRALPDRENLRQCIELYADYYNLLQDVKQSKQGKYSEKYNVTTHTLVREPLIDGKQLAEDFIEFSAKKERGLEHNAVLVARLKGMIKVTADYFRRAFLDVEIENLKQIELRHRPISLHEQTRALNTSGTYSRQELFTTGFFQKRVKTTLEEKSAQNAEEKPQFNPMCRML